MPNIQAGGEVVVIGIDCATEPEKIGLARAIHRKGAVARIEWAGTVPKPHDRKNWWCVVVEEIAGWVGNARQRHVPILLALDAPLGWPDEMRHVLQTHVAGALPTPDGVTFSGPEDEKKHRDLMFARRTDRVVYDKVEKKPIDVGAEKIARAAHAALYLLHSIREHTKMDIPLAWTPGCVAEAQAIEVYPAATLESRGVSSMGYKGRADEERGDGKTNAEIRGERLRELRAEVEVPERVIPTAIETDHAFDAVVCCLAAADFVDESVIPLDEEPPLRAEREGWIWVKPRQS